MCYIQDSISERTMDSSFIAFFPTLHHLDWDLITTDMQRRNCLETLGDAVMSLSIADLLPKLLPDRSLQVYSAIRSPLVSNQTFRHILANAGIYIGRPQLRCKEAGNAFEIYVGAFSETEGFDAANAWVAELFEPLVYAAVEAYDFHSYRPLSKTPASYGENKRPCDDDQLESRKRRRRDSFSVSNIQCWLSGIDRDRHLSHRTPTTIAEPAVLCKHTTNATTKYERSSLIKILADGNLALRKLRRSSVSRQE